MKKRSSSAIAASSTLESQQQQEQRSKTLKRKSELQIERVKQLRPEQFYQTYVKARLPCIFEEYFDPKLKEAAAKWQDPSYLIKHTKQCKAIIEVREEQETGFGKGKHAKMPFKQFVQKVLIEKDTHYYLSASNDTEGEEHSLMTPPLSLLHKSDDVPLQHELFGHLELDRVNLWIGRSEEGSSSGLHHDFHDNIYVLLAGQKTFRLYPPSSLSEIPTNGKNGKVAHPNGLIHYEGKETRCDGAPIADVKVYQAEKEKQKAEDAVAKLQDEVDRGVKGAAKRLKDAETKLEKCLDSYLESLGDIDDEDDATTSAEDTKRPDNFAISSTTSLTPIVITIKQGEMLYLPASWFHEVISSGGLHMALNYWFAPPDSVHGTFDAPYPDDFWKDRNSNLL
jgi:hypothetical protein